MYTCPHCNSPTVSVWRKLSATRFRPARCPQCHGLSYVSGWAHGVGGVLAELVFWSGIVAALYFRSWLVFALVPVSVLLALIVIDLPFPLKLTDAEAVQVARRSAWWQAGAAVAVLGLFALYSR
jgi:hypothetical protein